MTPHDAAKILSITGDVTFEVVKAAFRRAAMQYHPDRNPAGTEMMKMVNAAFDALKEFTGTIVREDDTESERCYPDDVNDALSAVIDLAGLKIEICGAWVWVDGDTYKHKKALKEEKFRFAGKKKKWYFRPSDWKSTSRGVFAMDDIRDKYGCDHLRRAERVAIEQS